MIGERRDQAYDAFRDSLLRLPRGVVRIDNGGIRKLIETTRLSWWTSPFFRIRPTVARVMPSFESSEMRAMPCRLSREARPSWLAIDNALYVLNCIKDCSLNSRALRTQRDAALIAAARTALSILALSSGDPENFFAIILSIENESSPPNAAL